MTQIVTNREIRTRVQQCRGRIYVPVLAPHDVVHMQTSKVEIMWQLNERGLDNVSYWTATEIAGAGDLQLDPNQDYDEQCGELERRNRV